MDLSKLHQPNHWDCLETPDLFLVDCTKAGDSLIAGVAVIEKGARQKNVVPLIESTIEIPQEFIDLQHSIIEFNVTFVCQASQT